MMRAGSGFGLVLAMVGSAGAGAGCTRGLPTCTAINAQYVMVERQSMQVGGLGKRAEITETPAYKTLHGAFRTVALRLPDNCYQAMYGGGGDWHRATGGPQGAQGTQDAATLESACGIPLQVLESTLTKEGYQVLSWSTLMGIELKQNVPVHMAAQQLGADFVIIVNDMYVGHAPADSEAEARYRYIASDSDGRRIGPAELFQADRDWMKKFVRERVGNDPHAAEAYHSLQARLNATVVLAKGPASPAAPTTPPAPGAPAATPAPPAAPGAPGAGRSGEAIWFYNWKLGNLDQTREGMRFLFAGIPVGRFQDAFPEASAIDTSDPNRHYWWPTVPAAFAVPEAPRDRATSEESFASKFENPEAEAILYRQIAEDFVRRFKGG